MNWMMGVESDLIALTYEMERENIQTMRVEDGLVVFFSRASFQSLHTLGEE